MTHDTSKLVERLRKVEGGPFPPDEIGTCWYRNPDGPEAATALEQQSAEIARLREAQRDFIDYHRSQLLNYLLPTANKLKNWSTINYHIQKLHEGGATAIAALSLPTDKTVELLREAQEALEWIDGVTSDSYVQDKANETLAKLDSHLGEMK